MATEHSIQSGAEISTIQRGIVAGSAGVQLSPVAQGLAVFCIWTEQIELRGAGCIQRLRQRLFLVHQITEAPAMAFGLLRQMRFIILGVGDQAVAAHRQHLHARVVIGIQTGQLRFHMLHEGTVGADHHQQHRSLVEFRAVAMPALDHGQVEQRQRCVQWQHRGWCEGHGIAADSVLSPSG